MGILLRLVRRGWLLLIGGAVLAQAGPAQPTANTAALPPGLMRLLRLPLEDQERADAARLQAARPLWAADSLGRLLVHSRLGLDYFHLHQADSLRQHLRLAWRAASPALRQRYPAEVQKIAEQLAEYHYEQGAQDSALHYHRQAIILFHQAGFDSSYSPAHPRRLLTGYKWTQGRALAGSLANAGSNSRHLGNLPEALRYYERAAALYQQQHDLPGAIWTQSMVGEAYAEQGNRDQALLTYGQALRWARTHLQQDAKQGSHILAGLVLGYCAPLLLAATRQQAAASQLAAEAARALHAAYSPQALRASSHDALLLAQLQLVPAEAALRTGQPATRWLAAANRWLLYGTSQDATHPWRDPLYAQVQARALGLRAWQQHPTTPAAARQQLDQAVALLNEIGIYNTQVITSQQLANYCLAMGEPGRATQLLRPVLRHYQQSGSPLLLERATELLAQAYAGAGRYDSAYLYARRTQALTDTMRASRQFAALAATEARFHTREQAGQIRLLTERGQQQTQRARLAAGGATLLALLLLVAGLAWRTTRRLNRRLAAQGELLQAQADRLGELDEAKNQFFANVSHELRTPLTLVLGPLDTLLSAAPPALPPAVRAPVALAHRHAQRLLELVNRILDLTKLQAGRLTLHPAPTPLAALLRRVVAQFESLATERGIALVGVGAVISEELCGLLDADKVEHILTNLLINALNHTPAGGTVAVELALPQSADPTHPAGQYAVTVRDTGPGIAAGEQARVFERFYQSPQGHAQGGTGLGLALSRELAQLLGGALTLASKPGQGAAFTLRFPAPTLPTSAAAPESTNEVVPEPTPIAGVGPEEGAPTATGPRARVLVVEDQPDLREYLRQLLAPAYEVLTAEDGQAALDLLAREAPIDLLTTDAMMPRLSGTQLLARLRADDALRSIPVLMLTARADQAHRLAALTLGVDDYLTKPFATAELLARVRTLLARHQVRRHFATLPPGELPGEAEPSLADTDDEPLLNPLPPTAPALSLATPAVLRKTAPQPTGEHLAQWQALAMAQLADPDFGPAELAGLLCLSERTLYRRLGELAGLTPAAWLRELRLAQARRLLEAGGFGTLSEVADAVGFASTKYFTTLYTERFGRRPGDYRS